MTKKKTKTEEIEQTPDAVAQEEREAASAMLAEVQGFVIQTRDDLQLAAEVLADVKGRAKRLDEREKEITKPLNAALKSARDLFRPAKNVLSEIEARIKGQIAAFQADENRRNQEAMRLAAEAHASGDARGTQEALAQVAHVKNVAGLTTYQKWDFKITNAAELPREFLMPNETLIKEHAAHTIGDAEPTKIPGVRFFPRIVVSSRST